MKRAAVIAPLSLFASSLFFGSALAANHPGDFSFTAGIGESGTKNDNTYRSDQALCFSLLYQKSGYAAYRASSGFLSMDGREIISPSVGTRDADAFFLTGNLVFTPRFRVLHPFATAGVGFYDVRLTDDRDHTNDIELGINWGLGLDVQLLRWFAVNGEIAYHYITGSISNPIQVITIGGRFDF